MFGVGRGKTVFSGSFLLLFKLQKRFSFLSLIAFIIAALVFFQYFSPPEVGQLEPYTQQIRKMAFFILALADIGDQFIPVYHIRRIFLLSTVVCNTSSVLG